MGAPELPCQLDEGQIWLRQFGVSEILQHYRGLYTPSAGSSLTDHGDPQDGAGVDIGAIGSGQDDPADLFARVLTASQ